MTTIDDVVTDSHILWDLDFEPEEPEVCQVHECGHEAHWIITQTCRFHPTVLCCDAHKERAVFMRSQGGFGVRIGCGLSDECRGWGYPDVKIVSIEPLK